MKEEREQVLHGKIFEHEDKMWWAMGFNVFIHVNVCRNSEWQTGPPASWELWRRSMSHWNLSRPQQLRDMDYQPGERAPVEIISNFDLIRFRFVWISALNRWILYDIVGLCFHEVPRHQRCCNSHVLPCVNMLRPAPWPWPLKVEAADVVVAGAVPHCLPVYQCVMSQIDRCIHWLLLTFSTDSSQARQTCWQRRQKWLVQCIDNVSFYMTTIQHHAHTHPRTHARTLH